MKNDNEEVLGQPYRILLQHCNTGLAHRCDLWPNGIQGAQVLVCGCILVFQTLVIFLIRLGASVFLRYLEAFLQLP